LLLDGVRGFESFRGFYAVGDGNVT
jgi:hypothetical protein